DSVHTDGAARTIAARQGASDVPIARRAAPATGARPFAGSAKSANAGDVSPWSCRPFQSTRASRSDHPSVRITRKAYRLETNVCGRGVGCAVVAAGELAGCD